MAKKPATKSGAATREDELPKELTKALDAGGNAAQTVERMHGALHAIFDGNGAAFAQHWLKDVATHPGIQKDIEEWSPQLAGRRSKKGKIEPTDFGAGFYQAIAIVGSMTALAMRVQSQMVIEAMNDPKIPLGIDKDRVLMQAFNAVVSTGAMTNAVFLAAAQAYGADKHDDLANRIGLASELLDEAVHNHAMPLVELIAEIKAADENKTVH